MNYLNKLGLLIFLFGLQDFPTPDSAGVVSVVVNCLMVYGGAAMFLWVRPSAPNVTDA
jgi:hypothetical protein